MYGHTVVRHEQVGVVTIDPEFPWWIRVPCWLLTQPVVGGYIVYRVLRGIL
jgi:hypothetical protein